MIVDKGLDSQVIIEGLSQGILVFDSANRLVQENAAARAIIGSDIKLVRSEGWTAAAVLFNSRLTDSSRMIETVRDQAIDSGQPERFHIYRAGERLPCWVSALHSHDDMYIMVTIEMPDWSAVADVIDKYLEEVREVVMTTDGHAKLIAQTVRNAKPNDTAQQLGKRITGFTQLIDIHMYRLRALTDLIERLEHVRTAQVRDLIRQQTRRVVLYDFVEDLLETLDETPLVDPETDAGDYRSRIRSVIPKKVAIAAAPAYLSSVLRDVLRNAIMYSMRGTPVKIVAYVSAHNAVQLDVIDEGYGVRAAEMDRVFLPFARSRQPQIMGEFGYGLSLYLCKNEVEAMNGRIWFQSEEGVGTTFSIKLPTWRETNRLSSSQG
ncbi:MAG: ATP-binding protein [Anaerolineae bacterium]